MAKSANRTGTGSADTRFKKGVSGNPSGRPRVVGELRDLAREHTTAALQTLINIAAKGKSESARVIAANSILDRGYGKPSQELQHTGKDGAELSLKLGLADEILSLLRDAGAKGK